MSFKKTLLNLVCVSVLLAGCAQEYAAIMNLPDTGRTDNQLEDDMNFSQKLQNLVNQQDPLAKVKIVSDHFNVLIVGQVSTEEEKTQIVNLIKRQAITKQVWDYTTIHAKPQLNLDPTIAHKAQDRVDTEYNITQDHVQAVTADNVVYLMGEVNIAHTTNLKDAMPGVYAIEGVTKVVSLVQFKE